MQLGCGDVCSKDVQLTDTYRAEELDCYGQIGDPEKILSSEDIGYPVKGPWC